MKGNIGLIYSMICNDDTITQRKRMSEQRDAFNKATVNKFIASGKRRVRFCTTFYLYNMKADLAF